MPHGVPGKVTSCGPATGSGGTNLNAGIKLHDPWRTINGEKFAIPSRHRWENHTPVGRVTAPAAGLGARGPPICMLVVRLSASSLRSAPRELSSVSVHVRRASLLPRNYFARPAAPSIIIRHQPVGRPPCPADFFWLAGWLLAAITHTKKKTCAAAGCICQGHLSEF